MEGLLQDLLGELVHLPKQDLTFDLLNGHVLLANLDVQPSALQVLLGLPLVVQAGAIGRVELHIPWSKLGSEPTRVQLDRVLLLVAPQSAALIQNAEEKKIADRKLSRLREHDDRSRADAGVGTAPAEPAPAQRGSRFFSSLAGKLLKNLQVDLTNVIIRYTDSAHGVSPYSVSLALDSLRLRRHEHGDGAASSGAAGFSVVSPRAEGTSSTGGSRRGSSDRARRVAPGSSSDVLAGNCLLPDNSGETSAEPVEKEGSVRRGVRRPPPPSRRQSSHDPGEPPPPFSRVASELNAGEGSCNGGAAGYGGAARGSGRGNNALAKVVHMTGLSICCAEGVAPTPPVRWRAARQRGSASISGGDPRVVDPPGASSADAATSEGSRGGVSARGPNPNTNQKKAVADLLLWLVTHVDEWHRRTAAGAGLVLEPLSATLELRASDQEGMASGANGESVPATPRSSRRGGGQGLQLSQLSVFDVSLTATRVQMRLTPSTLGALSACVDYLTNPGRFELWRRFRPEPWETPLSHPRLWWRRACDAVQSEARRLRPRCTWDAISQRRELRKKYVGLYVRNLRAARTGGRLGEQDRAALMGLERVLNYEQVVYYRSLAGAHAKAEAEKASLLFSLERKHKLVEATRVAGGAIRRLFGIPDGGSGAGTGDAPEALEGKALSHGQREVLSNILRESEVGETPPAATDVRARIRIAVPEVVLLLTDAATTTATPAAPAPANSPGATAAFATGAGGVAPSTPVAAARVSTATPGGTASPAPATPPAPSNPVHLRLNLQSVVFSTAFEDGLPTTTVSVQTATLTDCSPDTWFPSILTLQRDLQITNLGSTVDVTPPSFAGSGSTFGFGGGSSGSCCGPAAANGAAVPASTSNGSAASAVLVCGNGSADGSGVVSSGGRDTSVSSQSRGAGPPSLRRQGSSHPSLRPEASSERLLGRRGEVWAEADSPGGERRYHSDGQESPGSRVQPAIVRKRSYPPSMPSMTQLEELDIVVAPREPASPIRLPGLSALLKRSPAAEVPALGLAERGAPGADSASAGERVGKFGKALWARAAAAVSPPNPEGGRRRAHHRRWSAAIGQTLQAHRRPAISISVTPREARGEDTAGWDVSVAMAPLHATVSWGLLGDVARLTSRMPPGRVGITRVVDRMLQPAWVPLEGHEGHADWLSALRARLEGTEPCAAQPPQSKLRTNLSLQLPLVRVSLPLCHTEPDTRQLVLGISGLSLGGASCTSSSQPSTHTMTVGELSIDVLLPGSTVPLLAATAASCTVSMQATASPGFCNTRTLVALTPDAVRFTFTPAVMGALMAYVNEWISPGYSGYPRHAPTPLVQSEPFSLISFRVASSVLELELQHEAAEPPKHFKPEAPPELLANRRRPPGTNTRSDAAGDPATPPETPLVIGRLRVGTPRLDVHVDSVLRLALDGSSFEIFAEGEAALGGRAGGGARRVALFKPTLVPHAKVVVPPPPLYDEVGGHLHTFARRTGGAAVQRARRKMRLSLGKAHTDVGPVQAFSFGEGREPSSADFLRRIASMATGASLESPADFASPDPVAKQASGDSATGPAARTLPRGDEAAVARGSPLPARRAEHEPMPTAGLFTPPHGAFTAGPVPTPGPPRLLRTPGMALLTPPPFTPPVAKEPTEEAVSAPPAAIRLKLRFNFSVPVEAPSVKTLHLELGDASLTWDTSAAQLMLRFLYLSCRDAFPVNPDKQAAPYYLKGFLPLPHDAWNVRVVCSTVAWRLIDTLSLTPSLVGVLSLSSMDVRVRLTAATTAEVIFGADITSLAAPRNANLPLSRLEPALSKEADEEARIAAWLRPLLGPLDPYGATTLQLTMRTYNEFYSPRASEQEGRTLSTELKLGACKVHHYQAAVMRIYDFFTGAILGAATAASEPYLGTAPGLSSSVQEFGPLELCMPASADCSVVAHESRLSFGSITITKQQPDELLEGHAGCKMVFGDVRLSAPCTGSEFPAEDYGNNVGVEPLTNYATVLATPRLELEMTGPAVVGTGVLLGVPESLVKVRFSTRNVELRMTPHQLAVLEAVKDYNLAQPPVYVMPPFIYPSGTETMAVHFTTATLRLHFLSSAAADAPPALTLELHELNNRVGWGSDLSSSQVLTVRTVAAHAEPLGALPLLYGAPTPRPPPPPRANAHAPLEPQFPAEAVVGIPTVPEDPPATDAVASPANSQHGPSHAGLLSRQLSHDRSRGSPASSVRNSLGRAASVTDLRRHSWWVSRNASESRSAPEGPVRAPILSRHEWLRIPFARSASASVPAPMRLPSDPELGSDSASTASGTLSQAATPTGPSPLSMRGDVSQAAGPEGSGSFFVAPRRSSLNLFRRRSSSRNNTFFASDPDASSNAPSEADEETSAKRRGTAYRRRVSSLLRIHTPPLSTVEAAGVTPLHPAYAKTRSAAELDIPSPIPEEDSEGMAIRLNYSVSAPPDARPRIEVELGQFSVIALPLAAANVLRFKASAAEHFALCYARPLPKPAFTLLPYEVQLHAELLSVWVPIEQPQAGCDGLDPIQALRCNVSLALELKADGQFVTTLSHCGTLLDELSVGLSRSVQASQHVCASPRDEKGSGLHIIERCVVQAQYDTRQCILACDLRDPLRVHVDAYHVRMVTEALSGLSAACTAAAPAAKPTVTVPSSGAPSTGDSRAWSLRPDESRGWAPLSPLAERVLRDSVSRRERHDRAALRSSVSFRMHTEGSHTPSVMEETAPRMAEPSLLRDPAGKPSPPPQRWYRVRVKLKEVSLVFMSSMRVSPTPTLQLLMADISFDADAGLDTASDSATDGAGEADKEATVQLRLRVQLDYFNRNIAQWEPVVECVPLSLELSVDGAAAGTLRMTQSLEIVLTNRSINALAGAAERVRNALSSPLHMITSRQTRGPYRLRNETGVPLLYGSSAAT